MATERFFLHLGLLWLSLALTSFATGMVFVGIAQAVTGLVMLAGFAHSWLSRQPGADQ